MNIFSLYNNYLRTNENYLGELSKASMPQKTLEANLPDKETINFKDYINLEMEKLNNQQIKADNLVEAFIRGEVEDIHTVMIAAEEARLSLELAVQIRNKCIEAYKEINNMQL